MSKGILPEGQAMSKYPIKKGQDGPGMDRGEYAGLIGKFNNGKNSASGPSAPKATGSYGVDPKAKAYQTGGKSQPKVAEAP